MDLLTNKLGYITIIAVMAISLLAVLDYENKIENLEEEIELNIQDYEINLDS